MVGITVNEILQDFSPAFKSIDFRIVAVKLEEQWKPEKKLPDWRGQSQNACEKRLKEKSFAYWKQAYQKRKS